MKRTKEESEQTKEKILSVALDLFVQKGYAYVSLNEIASKAGATRGAVYWHFKDKADIFKALLEYEQNDYSQIYKTTDSQHGGEVGKVIVFVKSFFKQLVEDKKCRQIEKLLMFDIFPEKEAKMVLDYQELTMNVFKKTLKKNLVAAQKKQELGLDGNINYLVSAVTAYVLGLEYMFLSGEMVLNNKNIDVLVDEMLGRIIK